MKNLLIILALGFSTFSYSSALQPETKVKLESLRKSIKGWAPLCHGTLATNRNCDQGDSLEFAGLLCISGDLERCDDIRKAQDTDGRWWRAEQLIRKTTENSFSRDMKTGVLFYFIVTKDVSALKSWMNYLKQHNNKMCDDATDTRCTINPGGWTQLGYVYEHMGLKASANMKWYRGLLGKENHISAMSADKGYPLMLKAIEILFFKALGFKEKWMKNTAEVLYKRQPHNPFFQYLDHGVTEEFAKVIIEACPAEPSEKMDDFFIQRELTRNQSGELIVVRNWGPGNTNIPVKTMANGHDCLFLINLALNENQFLK